MTKFKKSKLFGDIFPNKHQIDNIILNNSSPFILQTTTKSNIPDIFIGRSEEIANIVDAIKKVVNNVSSLALYIEGAGGSGKSSLFGHIFKAIKQKKYNKIQLDNNFKLDAAFIDAPEDPEYCNILYVYTQIMSVLGKNSFFDELSFYAIKKILKIIETKHNGKNPLKKIDTVEDYLNLTNPEDIYNETSDLIKQFYRLMINQEDFKIEWKFLSMLLKVLNPQFDISMQAVNELDGSDVGPDKYIKNKTDASNLFNKITDLIGWIYDKKKVGIIIGIDNIESLRGSQKEENFRNFFNMLLDFRNKVNRCLLIIIGTFSTWEEFISYLHNSEDYNQFIGLFSAKNIPLKFLELAQIKQIVKTLLENLFSEYSSALPVENSLYPFGPESIDYLYRISGKNIRRLMISLNKFWDEFQKQKKVEFISDAFQMMKKTKDNIELDEFEIDVLYKKLWNWTQEVKTSGKRSYIVEEGLKEAFGNLEIDSNLQIYQSENNPRIKIKVGSKNKEVRPDVVLTLTSRLKIGDTKKVEFQVKIYEENSKVLKSHIKTSRMLLEQKKIDYVYFVTTADFSKSLINNLKEKYPERIGGISPLTKKQQAYLSLIVFYKEIFSKKISSLHAKILIKKSLGLNIENFLDSIKNLPKISITKPIKITLDSFGKIPESLPKIEQEEPQKIAESKKSEEEKYPLVIVEILHLMYKRTGRYAKQTTLNFLKGKFPNYTEEEIKKGFNWLKKDKNYTDEQSKTSLKLNRKGMKLLENLNRI